MLAVRDVRAASLNNLDSLAGENSSKLIWTELLIIHDCLPFYVTKIDIKG